MNRETLLLRRLRWLTGLFIVGLVISGVTAIPLVTELNWLSALTQPSCMTPCWEHASTLALWVEKIRVALVDTQGKYPFLFYGTDWLAFGHIVIAVAFVGALRDPVRNRWLFDFGLVACALVIPWAFIFGAVREIPVWWRLIDCSFGVFGAVPLWWCRKWAIELERRKAGSTTNHANSTKGEH
jgi:hypothetical protein